jgi:phosphotriesterase-related protein
MALTHEHLLIDFTTVLSEPAQASQRGLMHEKVSLENLWWVRYNWTSNIDNLQILDEETSINEANDFFRAGGSTLVDVTSIGIGRDPQALLRISRATGLNVIMGAGYYIDNTHSDWLRAASVEEIADSIIRDVDEGVDGTGIRSGIIGEIGSSWPWTDSEKKVLEAAVAAQVATGAPLLIHPGRSERAPLELLEAVDKWGGDLRRTVMGHIERTIYDRGILAETAATGAFLNYDLFGHDESHYPLAADSNMPADHERIDQIEYLIEDGRNSQILLAHDVCSKHRLKKYGGHGFDHIATRVVPRMRARGIDEEDVRMILVDNPTRMLTFN